jgi:hypothetical protein
MREKTIKTDARKLLLDALELFGISGMEFQTTEPYSNLDLTKANYIIYNHDLVPLHLSSCHIHNNYKRNHFYSCF